MRYSKVNDLNIRTLPDQASSSKGKLSKGDSVKLLGTQKIKSKDNEWIKVEYAGVERWVAWGFLDGSKSQANTTPPVIAAGVLNLTGLSDREKLIATAEWYFANAQSTVYSMENPPNTRNWQPWIIPKATDCSTFTWLVYNTSGVYTACHSALGTKEAKSYSSIIKMEDAKPGDLLCVRSEKDIKNTGHILLIISIDGNKVTTIESSGKDDQPGTIGKKTRTVTSEGTKINYIKETDIFYALEGDKRKFYRFYRHKAL